MTRVTCRLTAKNRDQLRNPTLGNRVWATFTFFAISKKSAEYLNKTVTVYILHHTSKILQTRKKSVFSMLFLKTFTDVKFTVDMTVHSKQLLLSVRKTCLMLAMHLGLNSLYLWPLVAVVVVSATKSPKLTFTKPKTIS